MNRGDCYVLGYKTPNVHDFYVLGCELGRGELRRTYICTETDTGITYACKSTHKATFLLSRDVEDLRREIEIMRHLAYFSVENIVFLKGVYEDASFVHIVVELCLGGNLIDSVGEAWGADERQVAELIGIIVGVVAACHSHGVMLRDVKLENFMFSRKGHVLSSLKAIDFGLAVFFEPGQVFTDQVGSPNYIAPEVLLKHYGPESDVWSAGVILYTILNGVAPFRGGTVRETFDAVLRGHIDYTSALWPFISDSAKDLIIEMLCSRPSERLTANEVLRHPWFYINGVEADKLTDPTRVSSRRMNLEEVNDNSETDDDRESRAGIQHSDQDGSECSTTIDEPRRLTYLDQNHNGKSKLLESDDSDEEEYLPKPRGIDPVNSFAYENKALRAVNKSLVAENDALLRAANKTLISENDALRVANKCLTSENEVIKDTIKESKEGIKQESRTWFEIGSISLGPYSLDLKNLTLKRETVKK